MESWHCLRRTLFIVPAFLLLVLVFNDMTHAACVESVRKPKQCMASLCGCTQPTIQPPNPAPERLACNNIWNDPMSYSPMRDHYYGNGGGLYASWNFGPRMVVLLAPIVSYIFSTDSDKRFNEPFNCKWVPTNKKKNEDCNKKSCDEFIKPHTFKFNSNCGISPRGDKSFQNHPTSNWGQNWQKMSYRPIELFMDGYTATANEEEIGEGDTREENNWDIKYYSDSGYIGEANIASVGERGCVRQVSRGDDVGGCYARSAKHASATGGWKPPPTVAFRCDHEQENIPRYISYTSSYPPRDNIMTNMGTNNNKGCEVSDKINPRSSYFVVPEFSTGRLYTESDLGNPNLYNENTKNYQTECRLNENRVNNISPALSQCSRGNRFRAPIIDSTNSCGKDNVGNFTEWAKYVKDVLERVNQEYEVRNIPCGEVTVDVGSCSQKGWKEEVCDRIMKIMATSLCLIKEEDLKVCNKICVHPTNDILQNNQEGTRRKRVCREAPETIEPRTFHTLLNHKGHTKFSTHDTKNKKFINDVKRAITLLEEPKFKTFIGDALAFDILSVLSKTLDNARHKELQNILNSGNDKQSGLNAYTDYLGGAYGNNNTPDTIDNIIPDITDNNTPDTTKTVIPATQMKCNTVCTLENPNSLGSLQIDGKRIKLRNSFQDQSIEPINNGGIALPVSVTLSSPPPPPRELHSSFPLPTDNSATNRANYGYENDEGNKGYITPCDDTYSHILMHRMNTQRSNNLDMTQDNLREMPRAVNTEETTLPVSVDLILPPLRSPQTKNENSLKMICKSILESEDDNKNYHHTCSDNTLQVPTGTEISYSDIQDSLSQNCYKNKNEGRTHINNQENFLRNANEQAHEISHLFEKHDDNIIIDKQPMSEQRVYKIGYNGAIGDGDKQSNNFLTRAHTSATKRLGDDDSKDFNGGIFFVLPPGISSKMDAAGWYRPGESFRKSSNNPEFYGSENLRMLPYNQHNSGMHAVSPAGLFRYHEDGAAAAAVAAAQPAWAARVAPPYISAHMVPFYWGP